MGRSAGATPAFRADLARSARLLRAFRTEQADPSGYYTALATDTVSQLAQPLGSCSCRCFRRPRSTTSRRSVRRSSRAEASRETITKGPLR